MSGELTGFQRIKKNRELSLAEAACDLIELSNKFEDDPRYLSRESYKLGIQFAIDQISIIEKLHQKMMIQIKFKDPANARREHDNQMNTLAVLKSILQNRYQGKP